jgi:hypothetical protein
MEDDEYFYWLAESMGLKRTAEGAMVARSVYGLWDPTEHAKFMDFYREFSSEVEEK